MEDILDTLIHDDFDTMLLRLIVALVLSGLIGFEREINNHSAGFRTHILVGVGSSLMMILSMFGFVEYIQTYDNIRFDPARIPSYVISGIGFLGAGTIIVYGGAIRGLTTAASIWTVAGIGLVVGAGMYSIAIVTTILILISLIFLNQIEKKIPRSAQVLSIEIIVKEEFRIGKALDDIEKYRGLMIKNIEFIPLEHGLRRIYIHTSQLTDRERALLLEKLADGEGVEHISTK